MSADRSWLDAVAWNADGLVPAIAQEAGTGVVLTQAWMNREAPRAHGGHAPRRTIGRARGAGCGARARPRAHVQRVHEIRLDCDNDAILLIVEQTGGIACHTGRHRCFFQRLENGALARGRARAEEPEGIYGNELWQMSYGR